MAFNFKNNNLIIILLLILVIASSMCYLMMEKNVEGFINGFDAKITSKFNSLGSLSGKTDRFYLILNNTNRYRLTNNSTSYNNLKSELESSGNFSFSTNPPPDISYNAYLYDPATDATKNDAVDIYYNFYNITLNGTYDISSIPLGTNTNADFSGTTNILMVHDLSGYFYDISGISRKRQFNLILDGEYLILNGRLTGEINTAGGISSTTNNMSSNGWSGNIDFGDMFRGINNGHLPSNITPEMYAYLLQGNIGVGSHGYAMPFYSSFELAMNNPSNPLVNPVNTMNPLEYNQTLFGPNVTPIMTQNMCKNSSADKAENVIENNNIENNNNDLNTNDNTINSRFDKINSSANTLLSQNTGDNEDNLLRSRRVIRDEYNIGTKDNSGTKDNNDNRNIPPCPPCARCPESNFECKKVPSYEQGYENTSLPRPVLTDFSTFGI